MTTPAATPAPVPLIAAADLSSTALVLLSLVDGLAVSMIGNYAAMTKAEKSMISPPLERVLSRLDVQKNEALAKWADPGLLALGLLAWFLRVQGEITKNQPAPAPAPLTPADLKPETPQQTRRTPAPDNAILTTAPASITGIMRQEGL